MKGKRSGLLRGGKLALGVCVVWIASACVESLADEPRRNTAMLPPDVVALLTEADRAHVAAGALDRHDGRRLRGS